MKDLRQKLLATFQVEHQEHVQGIRATLASCEATGVAPAAPELDDIFRRAHSLKGAARAVDLRAIETLAHRLETLLSRVREGAMALDARAMAVTNEVLNASEDWLAAMAAGRGPVEPSAAIDAVEQLLGLPRSAQARAAGPQPAASSREPAAAPAAPPAAAPLEVIETVRLNAESLDRIGSSAGELLTESLRQKDIAERLARVSRQLEEMAAERARARRAGPRAFHVLDSSPELAAAGRYLNYVDHQLHLLARDIDAAGHAHTKNVWTLRSLATELQRDVRQARMVPVENVFDGFRKMVRDLSRDEGKPCDLHATGWHVEADRVVLQMLKDPVMHILRNAVSHGLESEADRVRAGKPPIGRIDLSIRAEGNRLHIVVEDDGRGVDVERVSEIAIRKGLATEAELAARSTTDVMQLVLLPGFSTSRAVTDLSGRGMGMSVVADAISRLQGRVNIEPGARGGTRVSLSAPLSVSSHRLLLVKSQGQTLAVPAHGIERLHRAPVSDLETVESRPIIRIDRMPVPVVGLGQLIKADSAAVAVNQNTLCLMVLMSGSHRLAVAVDELLSERDAIVKDLPALANTNPAIAGGILLEDGSVCLVLNPVALVERARQTADALVFASDASPGDARPSARILVVDDSMTTRTLEKSVLEAHGYDVAIAVDGMDALTYLRTESVGLVISDLQMPRLDGFGLLEAMKTDARLSRIPVIIVSSVENPDEQARGLALGADAYIVKRKFEQRELLATIRQIL